MRWLWGGLGFIFLAFGAIGIFVPLWPVTIFWILAAFCLAESHPAARDWIYSRPAVGPTVERFVERGEITRAGKIAAILGIILAGLISSWFLRTSPLALSILGITLLAVSIYVGTRREP